MTEILEAESLRLRGDIDKIYSFIELYALFNLKRLKKVSEDVYAVTPEVAIEGLKLIERPLTNMLSIMDERIKPLIDVLKEMDFKAYDDVTKSEREKIAVRLRKSEKTIRTYFNYLEARGLVSSDNKRPKTFTLLYPIREIEQKLNGILAKFESADVLIEKMRKEAQEWLSSVLEIGNEGEADIVYPFRKFPISNHKLSEGKVSLSENSSIGWQNEKLPILRGLYECPFCNNPAFFGSEEDLALHIARVHLERKGVKKNES